MAKYRVRKETLVNGSTAYIPEEYRRLGWFSGYWVELIDTTEWLKQCLDVFKSYLDKNETPPLGFTRHVEAYYRCDTLKQALEAIETNRNIKIQTIEYIVKKY